MVIIADGTEVGREIGDLVENAAHEISDLPVIRTPIIPWEDLQDFVNKYSADTIFLLAQYTVDSSGRYIDPAHSAAGIVAHTQGPVYVFSTMYTKCPGIVGGLANSGGEHGRAAGQIAVDILEQRPATQISRDGRAYQKWLFSHPALQRFGIAADALPTGSVVLYEPVSFIREHATLVLSVLFGLVAQAVLIIVMLINITSRRVAAKALSQREAQLSKLIENSPVAISISDDQGKIILLNRRYRRMAGYDIRDLRTLEHLKEVAFPDPAYRAEIGQLIDEAMKKAATNTEAPEPIQYRALTKFGTTIEVEAYFAAAGGLSFRIILDVTQRNMIHRQLKAAGEAARAASEAKSRFLANVSHEIRTPMNGILGMVQLLRETAISEDQRDCIDTIKDSCDLLVTVINDILDLAKIESGQVALEAEAVDLRSFLRGVAYIASTTIEEKGLEFVCNISSNLPEVISCDPNRLKQILLNLLVNASKFTDRGLVELHVTGAGEPGSVGRIHFDVIDTGIGIPADQIERVFEPFVQVDTSHTRKRGGTGLGLSICRRLVRLMGGEITLRSEQGKGSTFSFDISAPVLTQSEINARPSEMIDTQLSKLCPLSILIAEDNSVNQKVARLLLRKMGYTADIASNGVEAVDMASKTHYDLILMDVQMPIMDGLCATQKIRESLDEVSRPQIIALTAHAMSDDVQKCRDAGMDGHLTKPLRATHLRTSIMNAHNEIRKRSGSLSEGRRLRE